MKIRANQGRAAQLAASSLSDSELVEQLYLATLSRLPNDDEQQLMLSVFEEVRSTDDDQARRLATEDVLWTLLNTREFAFNH